MLASANLDCDPQKIPSDNLLVQRAKQGDQAAFEMLWYRYAAKIRAVTSRFARQPADAEDLTQETFLKAYCALPGFRGQSQFYSWLYAIAFNTGINFYNSKARLDRNAVPPEEELDFDGPETETIALETHRTLNDSITQLPSPMRDALVLNMLKGHDYETISRVLRCPIGTVRSRISRARTTVANALAA